MNKIDDFLANVWNPLNTDSARARLEQAVELLNEIRDRKDGMVVISASTLNGAICIIGRYINECDKEATEIFDALVSAAQKPEGL